MASDRPKKPSPEPHVVESTESATPPGIVEIESEVSEALSKAGVRDPEKVRALVVGIVQRHVSHSGPLPSAEQFQGYEQACLGSANRILVMAEKEQAHRHSWEDSQLAFEHGYAKTGLWMGLAVALVLVGGAVVTALTGHSDVAIALVAASAIGMVAKFVESRLSNAALQPPQRQAPSSPPDQPDPAKSQRRQR